MSKMDIYPHIYFPGNISYSLVLRTVSQFFVPCSRLSVRYMYWYILANAGKMLGWLDKFEGAGSPSERWFHRCGHTDG